MAAKTSMRTIELLYFESCPHWPLAAERIATVAAGKDVRVEHRQVTTATLAAAFEFRGSPTILIDGRDPFVHGDEPTGLACRIYQTPDGPAGAPTLEQLEAALES